MNNHINSNIDMITTIDYIFYTKVIMYYNKNYSDIYNNKMCNNIE